MENHSGASFIKADIQDNTELFAYLHKSKGFLEEKLITVPPSFRPKMVNS